MSDFEEFRHVEQERIVAAVGLDLRERHACAAGIERVDRGARFEVGNNQSLVNDTTQNRVLVPRNACASTPL